MKPPRRGAGPAPVGRSLADLKALQAARQRERQEAERRAAEERERALALDRERHLFRHAVGPVAPLRVAPVARPARPQPEPVARQRALDEAEALREAWSDGPDAETLLDTDEALGWRREGIGADVVRRLRRGEWALQADCDLHGLRRDDARDCLAGFLRESLQGGLRCVRVVHGKGNGSPGRTPVLKGKVRHWLMQKSEVLAFTQARAIDGGAGALLVLLQPNRARTGTGTGNRAGGGAGSPPPAGT